MAKDVDLSSREWTDLIFEGKNKEFGAYELRSGSVKRHNFAVIVVLSVLALLIGVLGSIFGLFMNLLFPMMKWDNESVPVKQGASVLLTMLCGTGYADLCF